MMKNCFFFLTVLFIGSKCFFFYACTKAEAFPPIFCSEFYSVIPHDFGFKKMSEFLFLSFYSAHTLSSGVYTNLYIILIDEAI